MEEFETLTKLYNHLEQKAEEYEDNNEISRLFQKLRDKYHKKGKNQLVKKTQFELNVFSFIFNHGKLDPMFQSSDEKGQIYEYPNLGLFDDDDFKYLIKRFDTSINPKLKATYGNLLWYSPLKNEKYANITIECYLELYSTNEKKENNKDNVRKAIEYLKLAYFISRNVKFKIEEIKVMFLSIIRNYNIQDRDLSNILGAVMRFLLEEKKIFKAKELFFFSDICWETAHNLMSIIDFHGAI